MLEHRRTEHAVEGTAEVRQIRQTIGERALEKTTAQFGMGANRLGPHLGHGLHSIRLVALGDEKGQITPRTRADVQDPIVRIERTSDVPLDAALRAARRRMAPGDLAGVCGVRLEGGLVHGPGG